MRHLSLFTLVVAATTASAQTPATRTPDLLSRMTADETFWQLFMLPGSLDDSPYDYSQGRVAAA